MVAIIAPAWRRPLQHQTCLPATSPGWRCTSQWFAAGGAHAGLVVSVLWLPMKLIAQFGAIHRVAEVVAGRSLTCSYQSALAHEFANEFDDHFVVDVVVVCANDVGVAKLAFV